MTEPTHPCHQAHFLNIDYNTWFNYFSGDTNFQQMNDWVAVERER